MSNWALPYPVSDHYDGKHFFTPGAPKPKGLLDVLRWKLTEGSSRRESAIPAPYQPQIQPSVPPASVLSSECRITLVNHSTVLIQYPGMNLLTDPIWSERASPFTWIGPRRQAPPGVRLEDLPTIDLILLSHNHYDHLDLATLRRISSRDQPRIIVPLGVADLLVRNGMPVEREMDWWDEASSITCVPARHFSARGVTDRNRTLWCGYWISTSVGPVYFAADTAFGPHFQEIRTRLGSPRIALLPIGAYKPEWFMDAVHMSPKQAVEAHRVLAPERSVAIHWGTFHLADDSGDEPVRELRQALTQYNNLSPFEALENGAVLKV